MVLHTITSEIRGGGAVGARAWVAEVVGVGGRFGLLRRFLRETDDERSGSGRSGHVAWAITTPGIYEYRGVGTHDRSIAQLSRRRDRGESGFVQVHADGRTEDLGLDEVKAYFADVELGTQTADRPPSLVV